MSKTVWALVHEEKVRSRTVYGISFPIFPASYRRDRRSTRAIERGRETLAFHVAA